MKNKEIKIQLKKDVSAIQTPNVLDNIKNANLNNYKGLPENSIVEKPQNIKPIKAKHKKLKLLSAIAVSMAAVLVLAIGLPLLLSNNPNNPIATEGLEYVAIGNNCYEVSIGTATAEEIVIDSTYNGGSVIQVAEKGFKNCENIKTVYIPNSVNKIDNAAFEGCINLKEIIIPEGVTNINPIAFQNCLELESVTIPSSVNYIGFGAFMDCANLKEIMVDEKNENYTAENNILFTKDKTTILCYAAKNNDTSYIIPSSVTSIEYGAFSSNKYLIKVTLSSFVSDINSYVFNNCSNLEEISVESDNTKFFANDGTLFMWKSNPYLICYPAGKTNTTYSIPEGTKAISNAFFRNNYLVTVIIPESLILLDGDSFMDCNNLKNINVLPGNSYFSSIDGIVYSSNGKMLMCYPSGRAETNFIIPDGVTSIAQSVFRYNSKLETITLPNTLIKIDDYTFELCIIKNIIIPNSVTEIGKFAFSGCSNLENIVIPSSVEKIGPVAFENCINLKSITFERSIIIDGSLPTFYDSPFVENPGGRLFIGCDNLKTIYVPKDSANAYKEAIKNHEYWNTNVQFLSIL